MTSQYTPDPTHNPATIPILDDSDAPNASNFALAPEALADKVAFALANRSRLRSQTFTTSGTWTAPTNVTRVLLFMCGGGGGGAGGNGGGGGGGSSVYDKVYTGGPGGAGGQLVATYAAVTPGTGYTVTIGAGGAGGAGGVGSASSTVNAGSAGSDGGETHFRLTTPTTPYLATAMGGAGAPAPRAVYAASGVVIQPGASGSTRVNRVDPGVLLEVYSTNTGFADVHLPALPMSAGAGGASLNGAGTSYPGADGASSDSGGGGGGGGATGASVTTGGHTYHGGGGGGGGGGGWGKDGNSFAGIGSGGTGGDGGAASASGAGSDGTLGSTGFSPGGGGGGGGGGGNATGNGGAGGVGSAGGHGQCILVWSEGPDE